MRNVILVLGLIVATPSLGQYSDTDIAQFEGCVRVYKNVGERDACFSRNGLLKGNSPEEFMAAISDYLGGSPEERQRIKTEQAERLAAERERQFAEQERQRTDTCIKGLSLEEAALVRERKLRLGMSEAGLMCSWGDPSSVNRSVGSWGVHKQFVYGRVYVYVENGKVTSWQD
jgi:hypothetical protein